MTTSSKEWTNFYLHENNNKPLIPESFIGRIFLSTSPVRMLKDYSFSGKKIIDLACGNGRHINFYQNLNFDTYGTEVSKQHIEKLGIRFENSTFEAATSTIVAFPTLKFDYVSVVNAIYYLDMPHDTIQNNLKLATSYLKPNGCIVVSFIGEKHFILKDCKKNDDNSVIITNDPLVFRNGTRVRPAWNKQDAQQMIECDQTLSCYKTAEILDECDGFTRHLYYITAYKND